MHSEHVFSTGGVAPHGDAGQKQISGPDHAARDVQPVIGDEGAAESAAESAADEGRATGAQEASIQESSTAGSPDIPEQFSGLTVGLYYETLR